MPAVGPHDSFRMTDVVTFPGSGEYGTAISAKVTERRPGACEQSLSRLKFARDMAKLTPALRRRYPGSSIRNEGRARRSGPLSRLVRPGRVRGRSRKRRSEAADKSQSTADRNHRRVMRSLVWISGGIALVALILLALSLLLSRFLGETNQVLIVVTSVSSIGLVISATLLVTWFLARAVHQYDRRQHRCPNCGADGALSDTGKSDYCGGESGIRRECQCRDCSHRTWRLESIGPGGEKAYGYDFWQPY